MTPSGANYGSSVTVSCRNGFRVISGKKIIKCGYLGQWETSGPYCEPVFCPKLEALSTPSMSLMVTGNGYHSNATYTCKKHYKMKQWSRDSLTRVCVIQGDPPRGVWTLFVPECELQPCYPLHHPEFGRVHMSGLTNGSVANFSCVPGFKLSSASTRTCMPDRTWSGKDPECLGESKQMKLHNQARIHTKDYKS